ncbi:S8 family serine peptidase [Catellatospora sichuanensis]|uniref:S8 family serine peptidase n=1 Tax=Catellatospora sichuanensis TaxID=1969805 RepID=UPI0011826C78|nr:S8 family serine peptidase [Catellatospora sichuanensis]
MIATRRNAAVVAAATLLSLLTAPAHAGPDSTSGEVGALGQAKVTTVTLITGDRAVLRTDANGMHSAGLERDGLPASDYLTRQRGADLYVIPAEAVPLLAGGLLDEELFNVSGLVAQGYDDASTDTIPLLAVAKDDAAAARGVLPVPKEATRGRTLPSASAVAFTAPKNKTAQVWSDLAAEATGAGGPRTTIWLDRKVSASLDSSVPAIGAPAAWSAGFDGAGTKVAVLDTGYDAAHPDLAGRVVAEQNFTYTWKIDDFDGHGTHVASTIAGSGAASQGRSRGVAPSAQLLVGKVLDDYGHGQTSWIIAGMEWAVAQGADVVNMSLGSESPDCTDPLAVAVEHLAATSGALFVVAAGNAGPGRSTVSSPGCAPSVLTVGAVDDKGATAQFSSRGAVAGGGRSKPDLAAPGVAIMAAKAGGNGDNAYTALSGTSMAAPHVAGAAAILAQQHPDWTPARIKAALVSAAHPRTASRVQEQGAGMLDVARATRQTVLGPGLVDVAAFSWPHGRDQTATAHIAYTNTASTPVTLNVKLGEVTGEDGAPAPRGMVSLGAGSVTVPAGGTAEVPVTVDASAKLALEAYGSFGGRLTARTADGSQEVVTPFAFWVEPETVELTIRTTDRRGEGATFSSSVEVTGLDDATWQDYFPAGVREQTMRLRAGRYAISAFIFSGEPGTTGQQGVAQSVAYLGDPEIVLDRDTVLHYDARRAHRIRVEADRPAESQGLRLDYGRWWDRWLVTGGMTLGKYTDEVYAAPTGKARTGGFEFSATWRMFAPELSVTVAGDGAAVPVEYLPRSPALPDTRIAELVDAGSGTAAELAAAGATGRLVLVNSPTDVNQAVYEATNAGALGVVLAHDAPGRWLPRLYAGPSLPTLSVTQPVEEQLRGRLAKGPVRLAWQGTPVSRSPYVYNLSFIADGRINGALRVKHHDDRLARVQTDWYTKGAPASFYDVMFVQRPYAADFNLGANLVGDVHPLDAPVTRVEYYTPDSTLWWHGAISGTWNGLDTDGPRRHVAGRSSESWYKQPARPGVGWTYTGVRAPIGIREANTVTASIPLWRDSDPHHFGQAAAYDYGRVDLYRNGTLFGRGEADQPGYMVLQVPDAPADYRLRLYVQRSPEVDPNWQMSFGTDTFWRFRSARPADGVAERLPLLLPEYDMELDLYNLAPAVSHYPVRLSAEGQPGYDAGRIVAARAWVSYGAPTEASEITDWMEVPVVHTGEGWVAQVNNAAASGRYVSLKVDLLDEHGNGVEQAIVRAYGVR